MFACEMCVHTYISGIRCGLGTVCVYVHTLHPSPPTPPLHSPPPGGVLPLLSTQRGDILHGAFVALPPAQCSGGDGSPLKWTETAGEEHGPACYPSSPSQCSRQHQFLPISAIWCRLERMCTHTHACTHAHSHTYTYVHTRCTKCSERSSLLAMCCTHPYVSLLFLLHH